MLYIRLIPLLFQDGGSAVRDENGNSRGQDTPLIENMPQNHYIDLNQLPR